MLQLPNNKKGKKALEKLQKPARQRKVEEELPDVPGASERIEKLEKEIAALKKKLKGQDTIIQKLWAEKLQRDMKER